jgi:hypothetical protein
MSTDDDRGRPGTEIYRQRPSLPSVPVRPQKDGAVPSELRADGTVDNTATTPRGPSPEALQLQVEALKLTESTKCSTVASTQYSIAVTYSNQGRWKEAVELGVQVVETSKRILGQEHLDTLANMNNLASTFSNQGR